MDSLQTANDQGDFQRAAAIKEELEERLATEQDPFLRTAIKRALWVDRVPLDGSGLFDQTISAMESDGDDIWIGTRGGDIARYSLSEKTWFLLRQGAPSLAVRAVNAIRSEKDRIWFLSYGSVLLLDKRTGRSFQLDLPDHPLYRGMQSLAVLGRGILVGTQSTGFRRILPQEETVIPVPELRNISFLYQADPDTLFAGTEQDGLFILDGSFRLREATENNRRTASVRALLKRGEGFLGGAYGNGLFQLVPAGETLEFRQLHSPGLWVTGGVETARGYCFSTLGNGLIYLRREDLVPVAFGIAQGLSSLDIATLEYSPPHLICGTQGQGLLVIDERFFE